MRRYLFCCVLLEVVIVKQFTTYINLLVGSTEKIVAETDEKKGAAAPSDFKALRESQGITLDDIFQKTRISKVNLEAIEAGDFTSLPAPVYTKTFIKTYCQMLGVDEQQLLGAYEGYLRAQSPVTQKEQTAPRKEPSLDLSRYKFLFWLAAVVVLIGVVVYSISSHYQTDITYNSLEEPAPLGVQRQEIPSLPATEGQAQPASPSAVPPLTQATKPAVAASAPAAPPALRGPYSLVLVAREPSWVKIASDGGASQEVTLKAGERFERTAREGFSLRIGNAGGVDVSFQGRSLGSLGSKGQVVNLQLPQKAGAPAAVKPAGGGQTPFKSGAASAQGSKVTNGQGSRQAEAAAAQPEKAGSQPTETSNSRRKWLDEDPQRFRDLPRM
ncbi:MAG: DUF4115 domain-containing protein [Smithellaceae bacterium]|nr:DUF4115 domain-containing protein [Smithellaceae bacterium]